MTKENTTSYELEKALNINNAAEAVEKANKSFNDSLNEFCETKEEPNSSFKELHKSKYDAQIEFHRLYNNWR